VTYQILVASSCAIHVVMQTISTKIISKCSIVVMKSLNLPEVSLAAMLSKHSNTHLVASLLPST
jgi:hypothetical protein